jgi:hypothetical protein
LTAAFEEARVGSSGGLRFVVNEGASATLKDLHIVHAGSDGEGEDFAIDDFGTLVLEGSTVAGGVKGALLIYPGAAATVLNSTLFDNLGGILNLGTATVENSTLAFNRDVGLENEGVLRIANTIVAENGKNSFFGGGTDCAGAERPVLNDHNLDSDGTCGFELDENPVFELNPPIGATPSLSNTGGTTELLPLLPGSPAIDAGDPSTCLKTDQAGEPRPDVFGTPCDIGADEWNATPPTIHTPHDIVKRAENAQGALVNYSVTATNAYRMPLPIECVPRTGITFPLGRTTVGCTTNDRHGHVVTATFRVLVTAPQGCRKERARRHCPRSESR